jgi:thiamine monophosphate kinase
LKVIGKVLGETGEFGFIHRIRKGMISSAPVLVQGIPKGVTGIEMGSKPLPISTDLLIKDAQFDRSWTDPHSMGIQAFPLHLCEHTASGRPLNYFLLPTGLSNNPPSPFVSSFYCGLRKEVKQPQREPMGRNTFLSQKIIINISLLGKRRKGDLYSRKKVKKYQSSNFTF